LSLIALAGLLANLIFHAPWADPIAALPSCRSSQGKDGKPSTLRDTAVTDPGFELLGDNSRMVGNLENGDLENSGPPLF